MTVAKSTTRKTTPRKTRTRKSSPKVTKTVTPLNTPKTATVVMNELNKSVEAKGEQPVKVRPNSPKLSRADYLVHIIVCIRMFFFISTHSCHRTILNHGIR